MHLIQSPPKESIHLRQSQILKDRNPNGVGPKWPLLFIWPPSILSTRLDKSVYFLMGETVRQARLVLLPCFLTMVPESVSPGHLASLTWWQLLEDKGGVQCSLIYKRRRMSQALPWHGSALHDGQLLRPASQQIDNCVQNKSVFYKS